MAEIIKLTAKWDGFPGAPGYSNFYFLKTGLTNVQAAADGVRTFFDAIKAYIPSGVVIQVQSEVTTYVAETGALVSLDAVGTIPAPVNGASAGAFSGVSGVVINWLTTQSMGTRLLRGKTFLVPLGNGAYEANGTIATAALTTIKGAAENLRLVPGADLAVWHRPKAGAGGLAVKVVGTRIPDMAAILRSRRS